MLVLSAVGATTRSAAFGELDGPGPAPGFPEVEARVRRMGLRDVVLGPDDLLSTAAPLDHRWVFYDDRMHYEARFPHDPTAVASVSFYAAIALASGGHAPDAELAQVRVGVVELARHALRQGRPLAARPRLTVGFRFDPRGIEGWVQDECAPGPPAPPDAAAGLRGDGLTLAHRLFDRIDHEYRRGNRFTFHRRSRA